MWGMVGVSAWAFCFVGVVGWGRSVFVKEAGRFYIRLLRRGGDVMREGLMGDVVFRRGICEGSFQCFGKWGVSHRRLFNIHYGN